jgi:DeoR/GlpR family transcriptional regulator of sugar metabolism
MLTIAHYRSKSGGFPASVLAVRHRRHLELVRRLRADGTASVGELARILGVSSATIRRDLRQLDRAGVLVRVHGGATVDTATVDTVADWSAERPFAEVAADQAGDKALVARRAAGLVEDGEVLLLDIGTTTVMLARELRGRPVTVITASLAVLDVLRDDPKVELILLGGLLRRTYLSLVGTLTEDALSQVRADRAFLGASGVRSTGVLDTTLVEVPVKRAIVAAADRVVLLADRHKLPGTGSLRVCGLGAVDVLVTNRGADPGTLEVCAGAGTQVLLA